MKPRSYSRELVLLTLPVVLLAGVGWWISKGGSTLSLRGLPPDLYTGKPRLDVSASEPLKLSAWDVSQGNVWGRNVTLWQKGVAPNSSAERSSGQGQLVARIVYKKVGSWREAAARKGLYMISTAYTVGDGQSWNGFNSKYPMEFRVNLAGVPLDAEEIRLRGHFQYVNYYQGAGCRGIVPDSNWKIYPKSCIYTTRSKEFDWPLKTSNGSWPRPNVSRIPNLQLVGAHWMYTPHMYSVALHLRDPAGVLASKNRGDIALSNFSLKDGNGKPIKLYYTGTKSAPQPFYTSSLSFVFRGALNPKLPANDYVADIAIHAEPLNGWGSVKGPLHVRAQISDWTSWPTPIDVKMNLKSGHFKDIGGKDGTSP